MEPADIVPIIDLVVRARVAIDLLFIVDENGRIAGRGFSHTMRAIDDQLLIANKDLVLLRQRLEQLHEEAMTRVRQGADQ